MSIKIHTLITLYPLCTLGCPVSISAVRKVVMAEIWPPSWCLHSPDTGEYEERKKARGRLGERITYSCSAATQSPPRLKASGHGDNILWLTLGPRVDFMGGCLCVDERGADKGDLHNMFKVCCLRCAFVSVHSNRTFTRVECSLKQLVQRD